jgi:hypothetical protein
VAATRVRFHYADGRVVTQQLTAFAKANRCRGRAETLALLAQWEREGLIKRRADGGYDVRRIVKPKAPSPIRRGLGSLLTGTGDSLGSLLTGEVE